MADSSRLSPPLKYGINESVTKPHVLKMFVQSAIDKETEEFLETYCSETESSVNLSGVVILSDWSLKDFIIISRTDNLRKFLPSVKI